MRWRMALFMAAALIAGSMAYNQWPLERFSRDSAPPVAADNAVRLAEAAGELCRHYREHPSPLGIVEQIGTEPSRSRVVVRLALITVGFAELSHQRQLDALTAACPPPSNPVWKRLTGAETIAVQAVANDATAICPTR
jgi:hypothetical protein